MSNLPTPSADVDIDEVMVRGLLEEQHPDLAERPLQMIEAGWDNAMFRLGENLCVRLPRRAAAVPLIEHEQRWLPTLAGSLPIAVPGPLRLGLPGRRYPWRWSVVPWLSGTSADLVEPCSAEAAVLADFLKALHRPPPSDAPRNPYRGVPLRERAHVVEARMHELEEATPWVNAEVWHVWNAALRAPVDCEPTWTHGDLHARNVLVDGGAISGVIDWGDMGAGDCATDLASVWMLFGDFKARQTAMREYRLADGMWTRARGWAVAFGVMLLSNGLTDNPRHCLMGERTLRRVVAGP